MGARAKTSKGKPGPKGYGGIRSKPGLMFPDPGPSSPDVREPLDDADRRRLQNELHDHYMQCLTYRAVHINDPDARSKLASHAMYILNQGLEPGPTLRKWLAMVLYRLNAHDSVPHLAKGNAVKVGERVERVRELARYMIEHAEGSVESRLRSGAEHLHCSYGTVSKAYYGDAYRWWVRFEQYSKQFRSI